MLNESERYRVTTHGLLYDRWVSSEIYIIKIKAICVDHGYVTPSSVKVRILSGECGIFSLVQDIQL